MRTGNSKSAISSVVIAVVFVVLATGMFGAFYVGQNSVRLVTVTQSAMSTTQTLTSTSTSFVTVTTTVTSPVLSGNVETVTLTSGNLFAGSLPTGITCSAAGQAYISLAMNNPGAQTGISSFTLSGASLAGIKVAANIVRAGSCSAVSATSSTLNAGTVTPLTLYLVAGSTSSLTSGQTYNYVINLANGQSVSGSLIAQ